MKTFLLYKGLPGVYVVRPMNLDGLSFTLTYNSRLRIFQKSGFFTLRGEQLEEVKSLLTAEELAICTALSLQEGA